MKVKNIVSQLYSILLSKKAKDALEKFIFFAAVIGFFIHLAVIGLLNINVITGGEDFVGFQNPIEAIYTPFSIILFYEIYCLIYYLPRSITIYIGKQFEVIALITIREIFDELAQLKVTPDINNLFAQPDFLYSLVCIALLFILIFVYYRLNQREVKVNNNDTSGNIPLNIQKYIYAKKFLALSVGLIFFVLSFVGIFEWISSATNVVDLIASSKPAIKQFFSNFYTTLIINDVLILLFSFAITDEFHKVMRNSGFVVATTLLKLSFSVTGLVSHFLVLSGVIFGTLVLAMYKLYKKIEMPEN